MYPYRLRLLQDKSKIQLRGIVLPQIPQATEACSQLSLVGSDLRAKCKILLYEKMMKFLRSSIFKTQGIQAENISTLRTETHKPGPVRCGPGSAQPRRERQLPDPAYLQDSASSLGDTHRSPVGKVRPPPCDPDVDTRAPAHARAPPPPGPRTLALPEGSQEQPRGRHVVPEAARARSETPRGACAVGASQASSPERGFRVAQRLGTGPAGTCYGFTEVPRRRMPPG